MGTPEVELLGVRRPLFSVQAKTFAQTFARRIQPELVLDDRI